MKDVANVSEQLEGLHSAVRIWCLQVRDANKEKLRLLKLEHVIGKQTRNGWRDVEVQDFHDPPRETSSLFKYVLMKIGVSLKTRVVQYRSLKKGVIEDLFVLNDLVSVFNSFLFSFVDFFVNAVSPGRTAEIQGWDHTSLRRSVTLAVMQDLSFNFIAATSDNEADGDEDS
jgi:hypothetical protein